DRAFRQTHGRASLGERRGGLRQQEHSAQRQSNVPAQRRDSCTRANQGGTFFIHSLGLSFYLRAGTAELSAVATQLRQVQTDCAYSVSVRVKHAKFGRDKMKMPALTT